MNISPYLSAPDSYRRASPLVVSTVVNGCGPGGWKYDLVPDTILGLSVTECCNVHDWMYAEGATEIDKKRADRKLLENLYATIDAAAKRSLFHRVLKPHRCVRAFEYYLAVKEFGHDAFWAGKEKAA